MLVDAVNQSSVHTEDRYDQDIHSPCASGSWGPRGGPRGRQGLCISNVSTGLKFDQHIATTHTHHWSSESSLRAASAQIQGLG